MRPVACSPHRPAPQPTARPTATAAPPVLAARASQPLLQRCGCGKPSCGDPDCGQEDALSGLLRNAVAERATTAVLARERTQHPDQTCEDDAYIPLRAEVERCKLLDMSCTDQTERKALGYGSIKQFQKKGAARWGCGELDRRIANGASLEAARRNFQATCFAGIDAGHQQAIDQAVTAQATCQDKKDARGCA